MFSVFEVAVKSHGDVKATSDDHGRVQDAVPRKKRLRVFHLVLQRQDDADALNSNQSTINNYTPLAQLW